MTDPKVDAALREFLDTSRKERADGNTIANLLLEVRQVRITLEEVEADQKVLSHRVDRHGREIRMLKKHVALESEELDTGQHDVEALKRELATREKQIARHEDEGLWWRRKTIGWIVAAAAWALTAVIGFAAYSAVSHERPMVPVVGGAR